MEREDGGLLLALRTTTLPDGSISGKVKLQRDETGRFSVSLHECHTAQDSEQSLSADVEILSSSVAEFLSNAVQGSTSGPMLYKRGAMIGRGSYGSVFKSLDIVSGSLLAIKSVRLTGKNVQRQAEEVSRELKIMQVLRHTNIVEFLGCEFLGGSTLQIAMPFVAGGSILSLIQQFGVLPEAVMRRYVFQIVAGLCYLHENGILHRDVKAANSLVTGDGTIKLADFGCAKHLEMMCAVGEGLWTVCGTATHMAPEVIKQKGVGRRADIYSLGCTVIEMASGRSPFSNMPNAAAVMYLVAMNRASPEIPSSLSEIAKDFVRKCLVHDPRDRPTAEELMEHLWIRGMQR